MSSIETDAEVSLLGIHSGRRTAQFVRNSPADLRSTAK
jgi:hypothetical protein